MPEVEGGYEDGHVVHLVQTLGRRIETGGAIDHHEAERRGEGYVFRDRDELRSEHHDRIDVEGLGAEEPDAVYDYVGHRVASPLASSGPSIPGR
jgi:hypothetical protein